MQVFAGSHGGLGGRAGDERLLLGPGLGDEVPPRNPAAGEYQELICIRRTMPPSGGVGSC